MSGPFSFTVSQVATSGNPVPPGVAQPVSPGQNVRLQLNSYTGGVAADPVGGVTQLGPGPPILLAGTPVSQQTVQVLVTTPGPLGTALFSWYLDGILQAANVATGASVPLSGANLTAQFPAGSYVAGTSYTSVSVLLSCQVENPGGQVFAVSPVAQSSPGVWYADFLVPAQCQGGTWQASFVAVSSLASQNAVGTFDFYVDAPGPPMAPPPPAPPPPPNPPGVFMLTPIQIPGQPPFQVQASYIVQVDARSGQVPLLAPLNPVNSQTFGVRDIYGAFSAHPCPVAAQGAGITIYDVDTDSYIGTATLVGEGVAATYYFQFDSQLNKWEPA
jgi:hypothetical protein